MDTAALLRLQVQHAHQTLEGTLGDISQEDAHREPGGRAFKVAANYAHVVFAEDNIVNGMLRRTAPLHASTWAGRTGFSEAMPDPMATRKAGNWEQAHESWCRRVQVDLPRAREYARAVYAGTDDYLGALTPQDLATPLDVSFLGLPPTPLAMVLTMLVVGHAFTLAGEMSATKGVLGLRGYPF